MQLCTLSASAGGGGVGLGELIIPSANFFGFNARPDLETFCSTFSVDDSLFAGVDSGAGVGGAAFFAGVSSSLAWEAFLLLVALAGNV